MVKILLKILEQIQLNIQKMVWHLNILQIFFVWDILERTIIYLAPTFLNFPQLFSTFLNLKQILMQNSHSLLRSSWPIFSLGMTLLSVLYSWWDCGGMKFKTSDRCNLFSCTQHFHFCQWNGKQNDKRLKTYWWDYGGMNGCYHVFPKFTFWSRNNDDPKKSRGVAGRGLGWWQLGLIPPILESSMVIPPKSHQIKYLEVYYKTADSCF